MKNDQSANRVDYKCTLANKLKCKGRGVVSNLLSGPPIAKMRGDHNHPPQLEQLPPENSTETSKFSESEKFSLINVGKRSRGRPPKTR